MIERVWSIARFYGKEEETQLSKGGFSQRNIKKREIKPKEAQLLG